MEPWLFAGVMFAIAGLAAAVLRREELRRPPPGWRAALAVLLAFAAFRGGWAVIQSVERGRPGFAASLPPSRVYLGSMPIRNGWNLESPPLFPCLLLLALLLSTVALVKRVRPALLLTLLLGGGLVALCGWWTRLATSSRYTGLARAPLDPDSGSGTTAVPDRRLAAWKNLMSRTIAGKPTKEYPEGWLEETGILEDYADRTPALQGAVTLSLWTASWRAYTPLTGLRAQEPRAYALWYPGGGLAESIHGVAYRPR